MMPKQPPKKHGADEYELPITAYIEKANELLRYWKPGVMTLLHADRIDDVVTFSIEHLILPSQESIPKAHANANKRLLSFFAIQHTVIDLYSKAKNGDRDAAAELAMIACCACDYLSELSRMQPEIVSHYAAYQIRWPLMKSMVPALSDPDEILHKLKLGSKAPIENRRTSKPQPSLACGFAFALLDILQNTIQNAKEVRISDEVFKMAPFNYANFSLWWRIARKVFLLHIPNPESIKELNEMVTTPSRRKSPSRIREAILLKIRQQLQAMAQVPLNDKRPY